MILQHYDLKLQHILFKTGDFEWTQTEQSWILSSFFYGYAFSQPFAGLIAGRYGGKWVFGLGNLITAVGTLLSPVIANASKELFIVIRVIEGLAEVSKIYPKLSFCFVCMSHLNTFHENEKRLFLFSGILFSSMVSIMWKMGSTTRKKFFVRCCFSRCVNKIRVHKMINKGFYTSLIFSIDKFLNYFDRKFLKGLKLERSFVCQSVDYWQIM